MRLSYSYFNAFTGSSFEAFIAGNIETRIVIMIEQKEILDFGCGSGAFFVNLIKLGASKITGVEINKDLIDIARSRLNNFDAEKYSINKILIYYRFLNT